MNMIDDSFDVIIIGAGPAGLTTALALAGSGLSILILDKAKFPRDKACGDALSGKVLDVLKKLPGNLYEEFSAFPRKMASDGIRFIAPGKQFIDVPFALNPDPSRPAHGFTFRRIDFDNLLLQKAMQVNEVTVLENVRPERIMVTHDHAVVYTTNRMFRSRIVVGSDGSHSIVKKCLIRGKPDFEHHSLGIRAYFTGISDPHPANFIELFFLKELLPDYFWIFPMYDAVYNVGLGISVRKVRKNQLNLTRLFSETIDNDPELRLRFRDARMTGIPEAHDLPLGPANHPLSGDHFLLTGDAASLIDPFTGEGIGNAMTSGEIAAGIIRKAFASKNFSSGSLKEYDRLVKNKLERELKMSRRIKRLASSETLFNFVVKKAAANREIREMFPGMYSDPAIKSKLADPLFYLRLLFKPAGNDHD
jgi:menaquinone-9 beta-reductase